ncbi:MAG: DUF928 domain-containing protein [Coleofasciculaceae cyanobacterium SM2_3_26]|nr:DUF928 domain-containing protein [Coleofasciculaceae cyanobacterium SM2_3_26]
MADRGGLGGGDARGGCILDDLSLTALTPVKNGQNVGLTTSARPTFFVYIPALGRTPDGSLVEEAEFGLQSAEGDRLHSVLFKLPEQSGTIGVTLSEADGFPDLETGKSYQWTLSILCDPSNRAADQTVRGTIQRVAPSPTLTAGLATATPEEVPQVYAREGIWHETLSTLAQLMQATPNDPALPKTWATMLESISSLVAYAQEPFVGFCPSDACPLSARNSADASDNRVLHHSNQNSNNDATTTTTPEQPIGREYNPPSDESPTESPDERPIGIEYNPPSPRAPGRPTGGGTRSLKSR